MSEPRYDLVPRELLDSVVRHLRPQRIILFGSRARGDAREDSDIDLLVVVDDDLPPGALAGRTLLDACGNYDSAAPVVERSTLLSDQISSFQNLNSGKMLIGTRWWMNLKIRTTFWSLFP